MTTKQIAEAIGKAEKTIRTWASKVAETNQPVAAKIAASSSTYPADYDLEETCWIIEYGLGKNAADLFRMSARLPIATDNTRIDRLESMVEKLCIAVATIPQTIAMITSNQPKQIEFIQDYYTIKGYASKKGIQIAYSDALNIGRSAAKLSKERGISIRKADDERFGQVNSYSTEILAEVFTL